MVKSWDVESYYGESRTFEEYIAADRLSLYECCRLALGLPFPSVNDDPEVAYDIKVETSEMYVLAKAEGRKAGRIRDGAYRPRKFLLWASANFTIAPDIQKYLDGRYWREKETLSFQEAVVLSTLKKSAHPPVPSEIPALFAKEATAAQVESVKTMLQRREVPSIYDGRKLEVEEISTKPFLNWLQRNKLLRVTWLSVEGNVEPRRRGPKSDFPRMKKVIADREQRKLVKEDWNEEVKILHQIWNESGRGVQIDRVKAVYKKRQHTEYIINNHI